MEEQIEIYHALTYHTLAYHTNIKLKIQPISIWLSVPYRYNRSISSHCRWNGVTWRKGLTIDSPIAISCSLLPHPTHPALPRLPCPAPPTDSNDLKNSQFAACLAHYGRLQLDCCNGDSKQKSWLHRNIFQLEALQCIAAFPLVIASHKFSACFLWVCACTLCDTHLISRCCRSACSNSCPSGSCGIAEAILDTCDNLTTHIVCQI